MQMLFTFAQPELCKKSANAVNAFWSTPMLAPNPNHAHVWIRFIMNMSHLDDDWQLPNSDHPALPVRWW
jgi:hypothetical protein